MSLTSSLLSICHFPQGQPYSYHFIIHLIECFIECIIILLVEKTSLQKRQIKMGNFVFVFFWCLSFILSLSNCQNHAFVYMGYDQPNHFDWRVENFINKANESKIEENKGTRRKGWNVPTDNAKPITFSLHPSLTEWFFFWVQ